MNVNWPLVLASLTVVVLALNVIAAITGSSSYVLPPGNEPKTGLIVTANAAAGQTCKDICQAQSATCVKTAADGGNTLNSGYSFDNSIGSLRAITNCGSAIVSGDYAACLCK